MSQSVLPDVTITIMISASNSTRLSVCSLFERRKEIILARANTFFPFPYTNKHILPPSLLEFRLMNGNTE